MLSRKNQVKYLFGQFLIHRRFKVKKCLFCAILLIIVIFIIAGCQATPTPLDSVSIQNTSVAVGNTANAMAWTGVAQTAVRNNVLATASARDLTNAAAPIPTKSSSSSKGNFEMSWDIYSSEYDSLGGILTIRKQGSKYTEKLVMSDGSSGTYDLTLISDNNGIKLTDRPGNSFGDYMLISSDGYLSFYDKQGFIYSVPRLK